MRLFVAAPLDEEVCAELYRVSSLLKAQFRAVKPVREENLHLTLKFLGDVREELVGQAEEFCRSAAQRVKAEKLTLSELGVFPERGRPRIIWAGLQGELQPVSECAKELDRLFAGMGIEPEERDFVPHITIARIADAVERPALLTRLKVEAVKPLPVIFDSVRLISSKLSSAGARYEVLANLPISAA